jgi:hypothetical protein
VEKPPDYPWFTATRGQVLEQGDLLRNCPRFVLPADAGSKDEMIYSRASVDAVILTQSCDLAIRANGDCEATDVLLCPYFEKSAFSNHTFFRKDEAWEEVRKGRRPFYHVLNACTIPGLEQDFVLIDFHGLFTLSVPLVREFARKAGDRLRLLPPYREHLAQAFARLFMRVGLPADIPPFGKRS